MVGDFTCKLSQKEIDHYLSCYIVLERVNVEDHRPKNRVRISGLSLPLKKNYIYEKGRIFGNYYRWHNEIIVNNKVLRVHLNQDTRKRIFFTQDELDRLNLTGSRDNYTPRKRKSILKLSNNCVPSPKSVSFDEVVYITPIFPFKTPDSNSENELSHSPCLLNGHFFDDEDDSNDTSINPYLAGKTNGTSNFYGESSRAGDSMQNTSNNNIINGEFSVKTSIEKSSNPHINAESSYSRSRKLNGARMSSEETEKLKTETEKMEVVEIPKRKRGRPKKNNPDPPFNPFGPKKKPVIIPKKVVQSPVTETGEPKRKRGRPRKKVEFGFHTIVSEIKTITLPSDLWSAHVSVTSKRSQVYFTRVVQPVSDTVPVECDRSVKFIGSINYYVKINNRNVELLAAPKTVGCLRDIEILLQIVHDININDPVLRYLQR